jgi:DNA polymerase-3 subunit alpha
MSRFVHLHTHSHYSFLEALPKIDELVAAAKKHGMEAVALTDSGNLHGAIEFYKAATAAGITPIIGVDAYVAPRSRFEKDPAIDNKRARLVLLAENNAGYKNLLQLVTKSNLEGFFEKPRVDKQLLREHHEGLIALIPSFAGEVPLLLAAGDHNGASASLAEYVSIFGKDNVFLEITHHPTVAGHEEKMRKLVELSKESGVPLVAQHDVYYLKPDDREACEVMRRIQHGAQGRNEQEDFSFVSEKEIRKFFKDIPDAVDRSKEIADRCSLSFDLGTWVFPEVIVEDGKTHAQVLREKAYAGLTARGMKLEPEIETRIEYELEIIGGKGYAPYFLVVSDLLTFAKKEGILTTTRGSAAGSLVSYLVGITNVDPIFYKLPFERFLNPERPKAPDIDMDFADNRRGEMIAYAKRTYGEDRVAQIGTFGTLMARAAVRDVCRALGHSYSIGDRIAKLIPVGSQGFPMTIDNALKIEKDLKSLYNEDDDARQIIDLAKKIEGCVRHVGVHAAGVVIAPTPLVEWSPLQFDPKGSEGSGGIITQYDMYSITDEYGGVGLLKFDFLGIKNLAILGDAVERVRKSRDIWIDIENIPIDDAKTYAMLARGETEGTFQLNGSGMTRYLKELRPTSIHDINAMVALYRPGPMESIPLYIERKRNPKTITYIHPKLESILDQSHGVVAYQDDVLLIAVHLAGYSWKDADALRKAMGKKIPAEMKAQKEKLIEGFRDHSSLPPAKAEELWKLIEPFAAYGFGKAHAASYGKVAYQTAYMKANYPLEYMAALLTADAGDTEQIATFVAECERMGIPILPPDINESNADFTVAAQAAPGGAAVGGDSHRTTVDGVIRFGLTTIKNFGEGISQSIIAERTTNGPFASLSDFLCRVNSKSLNKKGLEALIKCGALDRFSENGNDRGSMLAHIEVLLAFHRDATAEHPQDSLFGALATTPVLTLPSSKHPVSLGEKLIWEKELLGIYVSGHPLDAHRDKLEKASTTLSQIQVNPKPGMNLILPVLVGEVRTVLTKGGDRMAFVRFDDKTDSIEAVIFPKLFKEHAALITPGTCLLVKGAVSKRNDEISLSVENLKPL